MRNSYSPKTLQMIVKNEWVVESITSLGSGYLAHLAYQYSEIDPEVLEDIQNQNLDEGSLGEIIHLGAKGNRRVAKVEIYKVNDFQSYLRFDFRLLEVKPFLRNGYTSLPSQYMCFYKNPS